MVVAGVAESFELIPGQLETVLGAVFPVGGLSAHEPAGNHPLGTPIQ